jgi:hypothetical protein
MKNILCLVLMLLTLASFSCNKKKKLKKQNVSEFVWMQYDETKCENPWQFNWFAPPTDEQVAGAVKGNLEGRGIGILEIKTSRQADFISCEACNCPNGFHYFVKVNKTEIPKLKELKFMEASTDNVPK